MENAKNAVRYMIEWLVANHRPEREPGLLHLQHRWRLENR